MSDSYPFDVTPGDGVNTKIAYAYRDADNYKTDREVVVAGRLDEAGLDKIVGSLSDSEFFIPQQIGLPALQKELGNYSDSDHVWHTILEIGFTDADADTALPSAETMMKDWPASKFKWDVVRYVEELEGFGAPRF